MEFKKCSRCLNVKSINDFYLKNKKENKYHNECKICNAERAKNHYIKNKEKYYDSVKKSKESLKQYFTEYKSTLKCTQCGENHPAVLDFHHLDPAQKEYGISYLARTAKNLLEKELKKCIVLCSNCHRKLHWEEKHGQIPNSG